MKYILPHQEVRTGDGTPFFYKHAGTRQMWFHEGITFMWFLTAIAIAIGVGLLLPLSVSIGINLVVIYTILCVVRNFRRIERNRSLFDRSLIVNFFELTAENQKKMRPAAKAIYKDKRIISSGHSVVREFDRVQKELLKIQKEQERELHTAISNRVDVDYEGATILASITNQIADYREDQKVRAMGREELLEHLDKKKLLPKE